MACPTCHTGDVILHFDTTNDRCRFQCVGPVSGTPCGYAGDWMPTATGETLVTVSCEWLRGTVLVLQDMAETPPSHRAPVHPLMPTGDERAA